MPSNVFETYHSTSLVCELDFCLWFFSCLGETTRKSFIGARRPFQITCPMDIVHPSVVLTFDIGNRYLSSESTHPSSEHLFHTTSYWFRWLDCCYAVVQIPGRRQTQAHMYILLIFVCRNIQMEKLKHYTF